MEMEAHGGRLGAPWLMDWWSFQDKVRVEPCHDADCSRPGKIISTDAVPAVRIPSTLLKPAVLLFFSTGSLCLAAIKPANAAVVVNATQQGADVVFDFSGSIDLTGLSFAGTGSAGFAGLIGGGNTFQSFGDAQSIDEYSFTSSASSGSFPASFNFATSNTGSGFGIGSGFSGPVIYVTQGYTSGSALSGTMTFAGKTFAQLGMVDGSTYTNSFSSDSVTINVGSAAAVPAPLPILGIPAVLFYSRKLKKRIKASKEFSNPSLA